MSLSDKICSIHTYDGEEYHEANDRGTQPHLDIEDVREAVRELKEKIVMTCNWTDEPKEHDDHCDPRIDKKEVLELIDEIFGEKLV